MTPEQEIKNYNKVKKITWWEWILGLLILPVGFWANSGDGTLEIRRGLFFFCLVLLIELALIGGAGLIVFLRTVACQKKIEKEQAEEFEKNKERNQKIQEINAILVALSYKHRYTQLSISESILFLTYNCSTIIREEGVKGLFEEVPFDLITEMKSAFETLEAWNSSEIIEKALNTSPVIYGSEVETNVSVMDKLNNGSLEEKYEDLTDEFINENKDDFINLYEQFIIMHETDINI